MRLLKTLLVGIFLLLEKLFKRDASAASQCTMQLNLMVLGMACGGFVDCSCAVVLATDLNALTILTVTKVGVF